MKSHKCEYCGKLVDHSVISQEMLFQLHRGKSEIIKQVFNILCPYFEKTFKFTNKDELNMRDS